jgi:DNA-binding NarL/FixJ family response regulator
MKHRIVIVDDHTLIAKALTAIITNFSNFEVMYECNGGRQLQEQLASKQNIPDIILLDVSMPDMNGFETAHWLKENHPGILVVALSMQDDEQSLVKMIQEGVRGYLLKNTHPADLEKALEEIIRNGFYFPGWATSKVMMGLSASKEEKNSTVEITAREQELLQYSISEMSYKEIAEKMFCSPRTVEGYRDSLFEKLGLKSRVGLAVYALKSGYVK